MSSGPGRNDPCPCGSGKKYKRCCLGKASERGPVDGCISFRPVPTGRLAIMWATEAALDDPRVGKDVRARLGMSEAQLRRVRSRHWDLKRVAAMPTVDIAAKLRAMGIQLDEGRFGELASSLSSAIQLAEDHWYSRTLRYEGEFDGDFPWLAAIVLWERLLPERPCVEMADEAMQAGYGHLEAGRQREALEAWGRAWAMVLALVPAGARSLEAADAGTFRDSAQSLHTWCQHVEMELALASGEHPDCHRARVEFCRALLERFPETDERVVQVMLWAEAESTAARGDIAAAERLFEALVARFPRWAWGYVGWGDACAIKRPGEPGPADLARAESIYLRGLEACRGGADIEVLRDRLVGLWD